MYRRNGIRFFLDARVGKEIRQLRHHGDVGTGSVVRGITTVSDCSGGEGDRLHSTALGEELCDLRNGRNWIDFEGRSWSGWDDEVIAMTEWRREDEWME